MIFLASKIALAPQQVRQYLEKLRDARLVRRHEDVQKGLWKIEFETLVDAVHWKITGEGETLEAARKLREAAALQPLREAVNQAHEALQRAARDAVSEPDSVWRLREGVTLRDYQLRHVEQIFNTTPDVLLAAILSESAGNGSSRGNDGRAGSSSAVSF